MIWVVAIILLRWTSAVFATTQRASACSWWLDAFRTSGTTFLTQWRRLIITIVSLFAAAGISEVVGLDVVILNIDFAFRVFLKLLSLLVNVFIVLLQVLCI